MLVRQAYDGAPIDEIEVDDETALMAKLDRAARCFANRLNWLPPARRIEILRRLARLMEREFDALAMLIAREGGKPLVDTRAETARAINGVDNAIGDLEHLTGREIPMSLTAASQDRWAFTTREPIGVVAAICAFYHPLNLVVHQLVPAIAATGCPVIIKPATITPLSCRRFVQLVHEAGPPPPWCQLLIVTDNALAERLATHPSVAFLSFIGSARVGWHLRSKLPPGTRCALEHGGAAPVIVDRSVELDAVIEPLVKGGYYHAGQVCVSVQRIFVHADILPRFVAQLTDRVRALRVGDPTLPDTEMGPLILPKEVERVASWVADARDAGALITTGGDRISERVFAPTVIVDPPETIRESWEEIFGPVTCVYPYPRLDEAVARANSLPVAFQAAVLPATSMWR